MAGNNSIIKDSEVLARVLFSPSFFYEGKISPTAFNLNFINGKAETAIEKLFIL
jgi:hypothetical protein